MRGSYHPEETQSDLSSSSIRGSRHPEKTPSPSAGPVTTGRPCPREPVRLRRSVLVSGSRHPWETPSPVLGSRHPEETPSRPRVPSSLGVPVPVPGSQVQSPRGDPDPSTGLITPRRPVPVPGSRQPEKTCPPSTGLVTPKRPRPLEPVKLRRSVLIPHPWFASPRGAHVPGVPLSGKGRASRPRSRSARRGKGGRLVGISEVGKPLWRSAPGQQVQSRWSLRPSRLQEAPILSVPEKAS
ncbi:protein ALEX-like [Lutra lutra]|uniref:protein ALEX-like n=1 Tax=Lutra lutra TaxID=9657 RepID=UPI001FD61673|nr:protein ALEX-like [Lutra lutra]